MRHSICSILKANLKRSFWIVLLTLLAACGTVPPAQTVTPTGTLVPSVPTYTSVPPTCRVEPVETFTPTAEMTPVIDVPTPLPTEPPFAPIMTPDAIQVERWKEYQTELAKFVLSEAGDVFPYYETALCEWDILGRSKEEVYVWAICSAPNSGDMKPAVIHLKMDGTIQKVEVPFHGSTWNSDIQRMFPADVREKFSLYTSPSPSFLGRSREMGIHIENRQTHPDEPPLIVLSATPIPTPTP